MCGVPRGLAVEHYGKTAELESRITEAGPILVAVNFDECRSRRAWRRGSSFNLAGWETSLH